MEQKKRCKLDRAIGFKVRWARRALMLRQEDLALALQTDQNQVERFEQGLEALSSENLVKLSQVLKKPVIWFFDDIAETMGQQHLNLVNTDFEECLGHIALLRKKNALHLVKDTLQAATESLD